MLIHAESVITCDGCVGFSLNVWCRNHGEVSPFSSLCLQELDIRENLPIIADFGVKAIFPI